MRDNKIFLGNSKGENKAVFLPLDIPGDASYPSLAIYGVPGSGKSTLLQKLVTELGYQNRTAIVIDPYNSFAEKNIADNYKGFFSDKAVHINVHEEGIVCDLFEPLMRENGRMENSLEVCRGLSEIIANIYRFGAKQRLMLNDAIKSLAIEGGFNEYGFSYLDEILSRYDSDTALTVLNRIAMLTKTNIFRAGNLAIKAGKVNILDLSDFSGEDDIKAVIELIFWLIYRLSFTDTFAHDDIFICVDECQKVVCNESSMLAKIINMGRKQRVRVLLATQQFINPKSELGKRLNEICYNVFFKPADGTYRETAIRIAGKARANEMIAKLDRLNQGQFIISGGALIVDGKFHYDFVPVDNKGPVFNAKKAEEASNS